MAGACSVLDAVGALPAVRYALLDAARTPRILELLASHPEPRASLYDGEQGKDLAPFGPWLVALPPGSDLGAALLEEGWGRSWGAFLASPQDLIAVRRHLRRFLKVQMPDGRRVYFRYYDPRVLRAFLPACSREEVEDFFGPITTWIIESERPDVALRFTRTTDGLVVDPLDLAPGEGGLTRDVQGT